MSDATMKDQPEVAAPAAEVQPVEETASAAAPVEESTSAAGPAEENAPAAAASEETDNKATDASEAQNGEEKKAAGVQKTGDRPNPRDFKKNRKYDPSTQPVTDDPVKIRGQVCSQHH